MKPTWPLPFFASPTSVEAGKYPVHRRSLFAALFFTIFLAACGGSSTITPPPPAGGFSNSSLNGQYAFSMSGQDLDGGYIAHAGTFVADGNGAITAGIEDVVDGNSPASEITFSGGSYSIQKNGTGSLILQGATGGGLQVSVVLLSSSQGTLIQTDLNASGSGSFALQTPSQFSATLLTGNFVLDFYGVSFAGAMPVPLSIIGQVVLDGNGNVPRGTIDENNGTASGPIAAQAGTYQIDTSGNGGNFGRGTISFGGRNFVFYIVNSTRIKVIEEDIGAATVGDAILQSANIPAQNSAFTGSFVYLVQGASVLGSQGAISRVARFTADGNGGIAAISYDENNNGNHLHISQGSNISNATYAIDTAHAGTGRGTFTFKESSAGTYTYIFYLQSPTLAVIQDTSPGIVADGPMQQQTGAPFTNAGLAGNYAFNWNGLFLGTQNTIPVDEDYVGQYVLASAASSNITGSMDYTQLGLSGQNFFINIGLAGGLTVNTDGTNNNALKLVDGGSPSTTYNFALYVVNPNTSFMVCIDGTRTTAGMASQQSQ